MFWRLGRWGRTSKGTTVREEEGTKGEDWPENQVKEEFQNGEINQLCPTPWMWITEDED